MRARVGMLVLVVAAVMAGQGCAAIGHPPRLTGAGVAAGTGVNYTLDGIAFRTFDAPVEQMRRATLTTFKRMDITLRNDEAVADGGRQMIATAGDRTIYVELEKLTARITRMRTTAKHGWIWRDRATAGEIIVQTERTLDAMPAVTQRLQ